MFNLVIAIVVRSAPVAGDNGIIYKMLGELTMWISSFSIRIILGIAICVPVAAFGNGVTNRSAGQKKTGSRMEEVAVDFSKPLGPVTWSGCGFLHGIAKDSPAESLLSPLKIRYVRGAACTASLPDLIENDMPNRLKRPGLQVALGVYYGTKDNDGYFPGDGGDWATWEKAYEARIKAVLRKKMNCYWVLWNEPDYQKFWPRDVSRYREMWKRAFRMVRAQDRRAVITGPTLGRYSYEYLTSFLRYCKANNCVPDYVTWHELSKVENNVVVNVNTIRNWCAQNKINIKGIIIDEYGDKSGQRLPGPAVGFLSAFERAKVSFAARAIWTKPGTLNGAATLGGNRPTGLWWVYKSYSDMAGTLYGVRETSNIRVMASIDARTAESVVLIGNQSSDERTVRLVLRNLAVRPGRVHELLIQRRLIPDSGSKAVDAFTALSGIVATPVSNQLTVEVGKMPGYAALEVRISGITTAPPEKARAARPPRRSTMIPVPKAAKAQTGIPFGQSSTVPIPKDADYWVKKHEDFVKIARKGGVDVLFLGDSITDAWRSTGKTVWAENFVPLKAANFGSSGDRTQNMLWRLENGELDGIKPKLVVLMIGTNNLTSRNSDREIADGIRAVVKLLRTRTPATRILVLGILPRGENANAPFRASIQRINSSVAKSYDKGITVQYLDIGDKFLRKDGTLPKDVMPDGLHPNARGYEIIAKAILPVVRDMLR